MNLNLNLNGEISSKYLNKKMLSKSYYSIKIFFLLLKNTYVRLQASLGLRWVSNGSPMDLQWVSGDDNVSCKLWVVLRVMWDRLEPEPWEN